VGTLLGMRNSSSVWPFGQLDYYLRLWQHGILLYVGALCLMFLCASPNAIFGQDNNTGKLSLRTGKEIFLAGCVGCHGPDGKGMAETTTGFEKPSTFPDFTACDQTTPEYDVDYKATIRDGGRARGFSRIMPSFGGVLTPEQIDLVVGYLRSLCRDNTWPRGELNIPRAIATEKAYPEDEVVITSAVNAQGSAAIENEFAYEHRIGRKTQLEISVPFSFDKQNNTWFGGLGDVGIGLKRVLFSSLNTGSILSVQQGVNFPSGNRSRGFGTGVTVFETFAAYDQLLPSNSFLQLQAGTDLPKSTVNTPRSIFGRAALGKSFRQSEGLGRMWSPMAEFLWDRSFETGAKTNFDVMPEFQVTLSQRQHVRLALGVRIPATNTAGRPVQAVFYLLWDWFDGRIQDGWK
jgi:mono/diheme cytochrome c family protein